MKQFIVTINQIISAIDLIDLSNKLTLLEFKRQTSQLLKKDYFLLFSAANAID